MESEAQILAPYKGLNWRVEEYRRQRSRAVHEWVNEVMVATALATNHGHDQDRTCPLEPYAHSVASTAVTEVTMMLIEDYAQQGIGVMHLLRQHTAAEFGQIVLEDPRLPQCLDDARQQHLDWQARKLQHAIELAAGESVGRSEWIREDQPS